MVSRERTQKRQLWSAHDCLRGWHSETRSAAAAPSERVGTVVGASVTSQAAARVGMVRRVAGEIAGETAGELACMTVPLAVLDKWEACEGCGGCLMPVEMEVSDTRWDQRVQIAWRVAAVLAEALAAVGNTPGAWAVREVAVAMAETK